MEFKVNKNKFGDIILNSYNILNEVADSNAGGEIKINPIKVIINGKNKKPKKIPKKKEVNFIRNIINRKSYDIHLRIGIIIPINTTIHSLLGEKTKLVNNSLIIEIYGKKEKEKDLVKGKIEKEKNINDKIKDSEKEELYNIFKNTKKRILDYTDRLVRKDFNIRKTDYVYKKQIAHNIPEIIHYNEDLKKKHLSRLFSLLYMVKGIKPPVMKILRRVNQKTIEDFYKKTSKLYDKGILDFITPNADSYITWSFDIENDLKIDYRGGKILYNLVEDKEILYKILENRGYEEHKIIEKIQEEIGEI
ncbi:MAG: hypothetical protein ACOCP8_03830 [archaeon]